MAVMVLAMLFIGVGMAASVSERYHLLVSIHKPLGMAILVLVVIRFINRLFSRVPPLPAHLALWQKLAATMSHYLLYALMFALPLVGWGMLSAARYPIVLYGAAGSCRPYCLMTPSSMRSCASSTPIWRCCFSRRSSAISAPPYSMASSIATASSPA